MDIFILLDRSGSMGSKHGFWDEAVASVNTYVEELLKQGVDPQSRLTMAVFDYYSGLQFDVLRNATPITAWRSLTPGEVLPRGGTPLLDALMRIVTAAEANNNPKTVVVCMTDGEENQSTEFKAPQVKTALDRIRANGWQVVFLGADFDAIEQAVAVGVGAGQTMSTAPGHLAQAMQATAHSTADYALRGTQMTYDSAAREASGESQVLDRSKSRSKKKK